MATARDRLTKNLRALDADVDRLPEIPLELGDYIARLTPEDLERIRQDIGELERTLDARRGAKGI